MNNSLLRWERAVASFLNNPYAEFNARIDAPIIHVKLDESHIEEVDYAETMDSKA